MSLRGRPSRSIALAATISAWVESRPPETPMTTLGWPMALQPLLEPGDLDVVGLVAVQRQPLDVVGHEREPVDLAAQADVAGRAGRASNSTVAEVVGSRSRRRAPVVVEGALPQPLLADPVEVDVDDRAARPVGEPLGLAEQVAALVDHRLAVPGQVGAGLALAGRGVDVRREAARARASGPAAAGPRRGRR